MRNAKAVPAVITETEPHFMHVELSAPRNCSIACEYTCPRSKTINTILRGGLIWTLKFAQQRLRMFSQRLHTWCWLPIYKGPFSCSSWILPDFTSSQRSFAHSRWANLGFHTSRTSILILREKHLNELMAWPWEDHCVQSWQVRMIKKKS